MYIILSEAQMQNLCGTYQEGGITREIVMGRKLKTSNNYAIAAALLNSSNSDLASALLLYQVEDLEETNFDFISIR